MIIKPYSKNAKKHPKEQVEKIKSSIAQFGCKQPLVLTSDGEIVVGHGRYLAMQSLGYTEVKEAGYSKKGDSFIPYILADDLSDDEIKAYRLADNKLNESEWEMELVVEELECLPVELQEITGFEIDKEAEEDDFEAPPIDEVQTDIQLGDVFKLGNHRLMCGDSTKIEDVEKLMNGDKVDMVFTDPPYGMGKKEILNDSSEVFNDIISFTLEMSRLFANGRLHIWGIFPHIFKWVEKASSLKMFPVRYMVWIKPISRMKMCGMIDITELSIQFSDENDNFIGNNLVDGEVYAFIKSERTAEIVKELKGQSAEFTKKRFPNASEKQISNYYQSGLTSIQNVFQLKTSVGFNNTGNNLRERLALNLHPTQKPIKEISILLDFMVPESGGVVDLFGGSGSTLIACEQTNRKCYMMELDPKYCEVICQRWEKLTGNLREKL
jgi:DNA modification methylase